MELVVNVAGPTVASTESGIVAVAGTDLVIGDFMGAEITAEVGELTFSQGPKVGSSSILLSVSVLDLSSLEVSAVGRNVEAATKGDEVDRATEMDGTGPGISTVTGIRED